MHSTIRGRALRETHYPMSTTVYDTNDVPVHVRFPPHARTRRCRIKLTVPRALSRLQNLMSKRQVQAAKAPDLVGIGAPGWNASTLSENMSGKHTFPDRPMMRQLSLYDSHKRADFNYRREDLDTTQKSIYVPKPNKFQANERILDVPREELPFMISRCEFPNHPDLGLRGHPIDKPRWNPATGTGGDPYGAAKAAAAKLEKERVEAMEYSQRHPPKNRTESLAQREKRFMDEQRQAKAAIRAAAHTDPDISQGFASPAPPSRAITPYDSSQRWDPDAFKAGHANTRSSHGMYAGSAGYGYGTAYSSVPRSMQVPVRKTTTWSLGGF